METDNLALLSDLTEDTVLKCLQKRFSVGQIYVRKLSRLLVVVGVAQ